jgi:hypothetical protein
MGKAHCIPALVLVCFLALSGEAVPMIKTLPVAELVRNSEHIVIGEVRRVDSEGTDVSKSGGTVERLRNEIAISECLKGRWLLDRPMIFRTIKAKRFIEDNVEFPPPGSRVLLFVKKSEKAPTGLSLVNGIQGLWPLDGNTPLQMGTGKTLEEIRALIRSQATPRK